ncbi:hypothetical protein GYMLUDRAFT_73755 [Collybiopsis luxurians FD-317 M1]|uniref:TEA domain-containing protein n=1 Tax=Collybiopsis luxurians FD-317 M1 TaxID=944289 RepID=A0A0D0CCQ5_9AGAR|nr:hypothetical protein GYMLUDRAFT_73755 [Collybiopsis luxurians FD-317 M1]
MDYLHYIADSDASSSSSASPTFDSRSLSPSYATAYANGTDDVFREVVKSRKSWKTLKGGKVVWPLHLEAALLQGLSLYKPDNSRETLLLGRFPMRNRFISEYIYKTTGEVRTAKQVGSRLQQLRDTCGGGRKLQKLLSPLQNSTSSVSGRSHYSLRRFGSHSSCSSVPNSPIITEDVALTGNLSPKVMYIDIVAENCPSSPMVKGNHASTDFSSPLDASVASSYGPRPIRAIKPCLAFTSTTHFSDALSLFSISHGNDVYEDESSLIVNDSGSASAPEGVVLYECDLVPTYWNMVCNSPDPTEFTIHHTIMRKTIPDKLEFSATYKFRYMPQKVDSMQSFVTVNPQITSLQGVNTAYLREYDGQDYLDAGNVSEFSAEYDCGDWQECLDSLPNVSEQRDASPGSWHEYSSCSSSSSPTSVNFPPNSQFYSSSQPV